MRRPRGGVGRAGMLRVAGAWAAIVLVLVVASGSARAAAAGANGPIEGPRLATFERLEKVTFPEEGSDEGDEVALADISEDGRSVHRLLSGRLEAGSFLLDFFGGVAFSPDGTEIAFTGEAQAETKSSRAIYLIGADGSGLRRVPGSQGGADPHFSPDGTAIAFSRSRLRLPKFDPTKFPPVRGGGYSSTTAWILDLDSGRARQLTPWRNGLSVEPGSFSPDGESLLLTRTGAGAGSEIVVRDLGGGSSRVLTRLGEEPDFSPDGSRVVFVGFQHPVHIEAEENQGYYIGDLYSIGVDGKGLRRLTDNRTIEASPAWDPSGTRIAYVETKPDHSWLSDLANLFSTGNRVREINADGTCAKTIRSLPKVGFYEVAWSPGTMARGPIGC